MIETWKYVDLLSRKGRQSVGIGTKPVRAPFVPPPLTEEEERAKELLATEMGEQPITPAEFEKRMAAIHSGLFDTEEEHGQSDDLMLALLGGLGYGEGAKIFSSKEKWYA